MAVGAAASILRTAAAVVAAWIRHPKAEAAVAAWTRHPKAEAEAAVAGWTLHRRAEAAGVGPTLSSPYEAGSTPA